MIGIKHAVITTAIGLVAALGMAGPASATSAPDNVALNKPVTLIQGTQYTNGTTPAALSVITDGNFVPEGTCFSCAYGQSVQWGNPQPDGKADFTMQINLEGNFNISGAIVQADNNDTYLLQYWNETSNTWQSLYTAAAVCCSGLTTRPSGDQFTYAPVTPVLTDLIRVVGVSGDLGLAVSEVELQGTAAPVPVPASLWLMLAGLGGIGVHARRRRIS